MTCAGTIRALGCPEHKVLVHYYGTDTARFRHPERVYETDGPPAILLMGRLEAKKGHEFLLQALRRVDRRGVGFRVVFVGDGALRDDLERIVAAEGLQDRVVFTGHVPYGSTAHLAHLRAAHVFAHPSVTVDGHKEGIPGTIVEAMASGLPVVATYHAGIPAVVTHGREGLLVPEHDVDALADALRGAHRRRRAPPAARARGSPARHGVARPARANGRTRACVRPLDVSAMSRQYHHSPSSTVKPLDRSATRRSGSLAWIM